LNGNRDFTCSSFIFIHNIKDEVKERDRTWLAAGLLSTLPSLLDDWENDLAGVLEIAVDAEARNEL
jgi:hypothetical protein